MKNKTITILGAGNMGASLLSGLIANGFAATQLWVTDPDQTKLDHLHAQFKINISTDNAKAVAAADVILIAVKPQVIAAVMQPLAACIQKTKPLIISVAAGIHEENLQQWLGGRVAIVRCMPNTPALIQAGASALFANSFVTQAQHNLAESILRAVSLTVWLEDEKQMDAVTAVSGSGPAYFFLLIEAMQQAGEKLGLSAETARLLTLQTAYGAAKMALESDEAIMELRRKVTSPGGTTEAAINTFETGHFRELVLAALSAAAQRSDELAKLFGKETR